MRQPAELYMYYDLKFVTDAKLPLQKKSVLILFHKCENVTTLKSLFSVQKVLFTLHFDHRHYHFFQAHTAMLKCILIIINIVIVIIRVAKKAILLGKNER